MVNSLSGPTWTLLQWRGKMDAGQRGLGLDDLGIETVESMIEEASEVRT